MKLDHFFKSLEDTNEISTWNMLFQCVYPEYNLLVSTYSGPWNNNTIGGVAETLSLHNLEAEKSGIKASADLVSGESLLPGP